MFVYGEGGGPFPARQHREASAAVARRHGVRAPLFARQSDAAIAAARERMPLCHITLEGVPPVQGTDGYDISRDGPELRVDGRVVARSHHHGVPVVLM